MKYVVRLSARESYPAAPENVQRLVEYLQKRQNIIEVADEITGVNPNHWAGAFDKRAVSIARAVEEFALRLLYRELELLPFGRRFRRLKGKMNGVNNSFIKGYQLVVLCLIYLSDNSLRIFCSVNHDAWNKCLSVLFCIFFPLQQRPTGHPVDRRQNIQQTSNTLCMFSTAVHIFRLSLDILYVHFTNRLRLCTAMQTHLQT